MLKQKFIHISIFLFLTMSVMGQDPCFTQFYANKLYLNPAFAGTSGCPRLIMDYRHQWPFISGTFVTTSASFDANIPLFHGGVGAIVSADRSGQGLLHTINVGVMYSYQADLTRHLSLKLSVQGTYIQKSINWNKIVFGDMIDPQYGYVYSTQEKTPIPTVGFPDFSVGALAFSRHYYVGAAIHHLTEPDQGFLQDSKSPLPEKYTIHGGATIYLDQPGHNTLSPNLIIQNQAYITQINIGLYTKLENSLVGGLWYRLNDSFIILMGVEQKSFTYGFSYDFTVSKLSMRTAGAMEFSASYIIPCKPDKRKLRGINCPSF